MPAAGLAGLRSWVARPRERSAETEARGAAAQPCSCAHQHSKACCGTHVAPLVMLT